MGKYYHEVCYIGQISIKVNGCLTEEIVPERGLRQGDLLSPYLFLICAEAFSCLLHVAQESGDMTRVKVS